MPHVVATLSPWIALMTFLGSAVTSLALLSAWKARREEEWRKIAEVHEERLKVLEIQHDQKVRELFDLTVVMEDLRRNNKRLGLTNLSQQGQLDRLGRREKQLMAAMKLAAIPVPEADGEDDDA